MVKPKFFLGNIVECRQTGTRFRVIGEPGHCTYLPTGVAIYILSEDSCDCGVIAVPKAQVEADFCLTTPRVAKHPILDRPMPTIGGRGGN